LQDTINALACKAALLVSQTASTLEALMLAAAGACTYTDEGFGSLQAELEGEGGCGPWGF
jgi:hypothetical protein